MDMIGPLDWGAIVNYDQWNDTPYVKDDVAIHYNGPAVDTWLDGPEAEMKYLRAVERYHKVVKGWRGIAYGYAVGASGNVYRLRGKNNYGAHQGDWDHDGISNNKEIVPVLFILGKGQVPTRTMWLRFGELLQWLHVQPWTDSALQVKGHKDVQTNKPTECPGVHIMNGIAAQAWLPHDDWVTKQEFEELEAQVETLETAVSLLQEFELQVRNL